MTKTVLVGGEGEIVEKKSRFIAHIEKVNSEEEALAFVAAMKKKYYDARHNCHAFIIGREGNIRRFSDDGEPSGTAGRPMLDILEREGIINTVVVVTRYFGGTLLGTGGLVRAYQEATIEGLKNCSVSEITEGAVMELSLPYTALGKVQYYLGQNEIPTLSTDYGENITLRFIIERDKLENVEKAMSELSEGSLKPELIEEVEYAFQKGQVLIL